MGLAEISKNNPLKVLHNLLESEVIDFSFVGISNWRLDASKMNRGVYLSRPDLSLDDLQNTAEVLFKSFIDENHKDVDYTNEIRLVKSLAETYMPPKETTYGIEGRDGYQYEGGLNRELASEILENDFTSRGMRKKLVSSTTQPNTRSFFLSVQNPLVIEAGGRSWNQLTAKDLPKSMSNRMESRGQTLGLTGFGDGPTKQILRLAKEFGHDGVLFRSVIDLGPSGKEYKAMSAAEKEAAVSDVWGVVDSRQIKSTENKGGFNPKVGSTLYQSASPPGTQRATRLTVNGKGLRETHRW